MRLEAKDYIKGTIFFLSLLVYYFTVSKDIEIRIVKLEANSASTNKLLEEIRQDVKILITGPKGR